MDVIKLIIFNGLAVMLVVAYILTKTREATVDEDNPLDHSSTVMSVWFGNTNVCIVLDTEPASYFVPFAWGVISPIAIVMMVMAWLRTWLAVWDAALPRWLGHANTVALLFEIFSVLAACITFAIPPDVPQLSSGEVRSMIIHTTPFLLVQIALSTFNLRDSIYDVYVGLYQIVGHDQVRQRAKWLWLTYPIAYCITTLIKVPLAINAMAGPPEPRVPLYFVTPESDPRHNDIHCVDNNWPSNQECSGAWWCGNCPDFRDFAKTIDAMWAFLTFVVPVAKSGIMYMKYRERTFHLELDITPKVPLKMGEVALDEEREPVKL
jgi:hypothetical protein